MPTDDPAEGALPLAERLRLAAIFADRARGMFELWCHAEVPEPEGSELQQVPDFVRWNQHAHLTTCIAYVGILYDRHPRSISLRNLADELSSQPHADVAHLVEAQRLHDGTRAAAGRVKVLRDKVVAHRGSELSSRAAFAKANLTLGDFRELLDTSCTIADRLLQAMGLPGVHRSVLPLRQMKAAHEKLRRPARG